MAAPQAGRAYPVGLGDSFAGQPGKGVCLLRYDFKPASAERKGEGSLSLDARSGKASLQLPHTAPGAPGLQFAGSYEALSEGNDCIASFDGRQWHLELVTSQCRNLRATRAEPPAKRLRPAPEPVAPQPAPPAAGVADMVEEDLFAEDEPPAQDAAVQPEPAPKPVQQTREQEKQPPDLGQQTQPPEHPVQQQKQPPDPGPQAQPAVVPDWQEGFFPAAESSGDASSQSEDDSADDF